MSIEEKDLELYEKNGGREKELPKYSMIGSEFVELN
jgi:hypothetical protein